MNRNFGKILFLFTLLTFFGASLAYLELNVQHCEQLEGAQEFVDATAIKVKKLNKTTRGFYGQVVVKVPIDEKYDLKANAFVKQGGEYRLMPFKLRRTNLCKAAKDDIYFYPDFAVAANFPLPFECPLPANTYSIEGFAPSLEKIPLVMLKNGDYALELIVSLNGEIVLKWKVLGSVINI